MDCQLDFFLTPGTVSTFSRLLPGKRLVRHILHVFHSRNKITNARSSIPRTCVPVYSHVSLGVFTEIIVTWRKVVSLSLYLSGSFGYVGD